MSEREEPSRRSVVADVEEVVREVGSLCVRSSIG